MADRETHKPVSGLYTCIACQVAFESGEGQRIHYQSDWHRYNLKRKVASLAPITLEQFQQKEAAQNKKTETEAKTEEYKGFCTVCRKKFGTKNQYESHIRSKKHKEVEAKAASKAESQQKPTEGEKKERAVIDMTITDDTPEEEIIAKIDKKIETAERLEETDCLFCTHKSDTFEDNMSHMTVVHSFFIPDIEYLVDIKGLIKYLGEKISVGNLCLYCNGKGRNMRSLDAARKHMVDKGHCMIAYDTEEDAMEVVDYYDFSSSYATLVDDLDPDAELSAMTQQIQLADDGISLQLPNGTIIGHRSLKKYYDQKFKPEDTRDSVLINKLIGQYSEMEAYESMHKSQQHGRRLYITDGRKEGHMRATESFKDKRVHNDYKTRVGIQSNKLQKYFRVQIL